MDDPVLRLGAWCDLETEQDARRRLLDEAAEGDAGDARHDHSDAGPGRFVPVPGTPVLAPGGISFHVEEFAVLADGLRLRLHAERGFTLSAGADPWQFLTLAGLEQDVLTTVLPDDAEDSGDDHPWEWLSALLRTHGVVASAEQLRALPYVVEFSDRLRARLPQR